jgi:hypothetical protein
LERFHAEITVCPGVDEYMPSWHKMVEMKARRGKWRKALALLCLHKSSQEFTKTEDALSTRGQRLTLKMTLRA